MTLKAKLAQVLADKKIDLWWADEARSSGSWPKDFVHVADVGCSRTRGVVAVPRRRFGAYHVAEVLHEVAHLEIWRARAVSPSKVDDLEVCDLALEIARAYGFPPAVIEHLESERNEEAEKGQEP